jgi:hypothetical protein
MRQHAEAKFVGPQGVDSGISPTGFETALSAITRHSPQRNHRLEAVIRVPR